MATVSNHRDFVSDVPQYFGLRAFTDGRINAVRDYLMPYQTEMADTADSRAAFANRKQRLYHVNHCAPYLAIHRGHLSQPIAIDGLPTDTFEPILQDVTGYGESSTEAARAQLMLRMQYGRIGVLVDRPTAIAGTKAEARARNERSYQVVYDALSIRNWSYFGSGPRRGMLSSVLLDEPGVAGANGAIYPRLRRYTIGDVGSFVCEILQSRDEKGLGLDDKPAEYDLVETLQGSLEYIPFFIWGDGSHQSFLKEVWELDAALMNLTSVKSNINYNQGFQRSAATGVSKEEISKAGEHLIWVFDNPQANIITIPAGDPSAIENEEAVLRNEINRRGKFEFNQLADDTRQVQSAQSKEKDMAARKAIYDAILDEQADLLRRIYSAHAEYEGASNSAVSVKIERDFGLEDDSATSSELSSASLEAQRLGAREVQKAVLRTRVSKLRLVPKEKQREDEMRKELFDDIEAAEPEPPGSGLSAFGRFAQ